MNKKKEKPWTKSAVVKEILKEIGLSLNSHKECILQVGDYEIELYFQSINYKGDKNISLSCSLEVTKNSTNKHISWEDLRFLSTRYYNKNKNYLVINLYESFEKSSIKRECADVYKPFVDYISEREQLEKVIKGEEFTINGKKLKLRSIDQFLS